MNKFSDLFFLFDSLVIFECLNDNDITFLESALLLVRAMPGQLPTRHCILHPAPSFSIFVYYLLSITFLLTSVSNFCHVNCFSYTDQCILFNQHYYFHAVRCWKYQCKKGDQRTNLYKTRIKQKLAHNILFHILIRIPSSLHKKHMKHTSTEHATFIEQKSIMAKE